MVKLPSILSDNMVLQRGVEVPVWGVAGPGERVSVEMAGRTAGTAADENGQWKVAIGPFEAGGPYEMTIAGEEPVTLKNLLVGEVWVCSGQSNMEWPMHAAMKGEEEIAAADFPEIRLFHLPKTAAETPQWDVSGQWVETVPETVRDFSAVGYYFGRYLHRELGVPVGLVNSSWGGTAAEWWTRREVLEKNPALEDIMKRWEKIVAGHEEQLQEYRALREKWEETREEPGGGDEVDPPESPQPPTPPEPRTRPGALYNGMVAPLIPYRIRGVIWYQGESNTGRAKEYRELFPAMIRDWRAQWGQGAFPFLFVQLANFGERKAEPGASAWAELREAQLASLSVPNTAMGVIIDIGEGDDVHPKNKQDVGGRLALAALGTVYDRDVVYSGPIYDSMEIEGKQIRLHFNHVDGGLAARGGELRGFAVAGEDRKFVWADADIDGETVVVTSERVPKPVAVRYAWGDDPEAALYNEAGLPASPFRTDEWPG